MIEFHNASVKLFRSIGEANGVPPSSKLSDEMIIKISQEVMTAFKEAAEKKGEHISGGYLITIAMKFFGIYEMAGEKFYYEHIDYEIRLPIDWIELYEWSHKLQNCLSGYWNLILEGKTTVYGFFINNEIKFAVEIKNGKIVQSKSKYNKDL